jgi:hypothetical protein
MTTIPALPFSGQQLRDTLSALDSAIDGKEASGAATAAVAGHVAAADPHPQYLTSTEGNAAYATAAQGALAATAVQPGGLAAVATSGAYADLSGRPTLPTGTNTGDQTLSNTSNATSHTVTLSGSGGSLQLAEGSNVTLTTSGTGSDAVVTIAASVTGGGGGTVTSIGLVAPTGFSVSGSPVTTSGNITLAFAAGYSLPTTASQTSWDTAFTERRYWDGGATGLTAATGRTSLGLGGAAVLNVGTAAGTVAAGDDSRFTTDLTFTAATRTLASSTGADVVLPVATTTDAGLESAADKTKLDSITVDSATLVRKFVRNSSGVSIPKGSAVYQTGSSGTTLTVALADASAEATAAQTLGLAQETIANNANGYVVAVGLLDGISTSALTEGQIVWLSETAGALTTTKPTQPAHGVVCGYCVKQGAGTSGILYVKVDNGLELNELHDVLITSPVAGQVVRRASDGLWKNAVLAAADISGLGGAATLNVGTAAGTVAAGDDARLTYDSPFLALGDETTAASVGTKATVHHWPVAHRLTAIPLWSASAPVGSALQLDIRVGGTSIFSTLPTIAVGGTSSTTTTAAVFSTAFVTANQTIAAGSLVTFHVTQAPSGGGGAGAKVLMPAVRA